MRVPKGNAARRLRQPVVKSARAPLPSVASPFLTTAEAAAYCRYRSPSAIRNHVLAGRLRPAGRRGRALLFRREALEAMLAGYGAPMAPGGMHHAEAENAIRGL